VASEGGKLEPSEPGPAAKSAASRAGEVARTLDFRQRVASEGGKLEVLCAVMLALCGTLWVTGSLASAVVFEGAATAMLLWSSSMGLALVIIGLGGLASLGRLSRRRG
jgi:hypothetical protein